MNFKIDKNPVRKLLGSKGEKELRSKIQQCYPDFGSASPGKDTTLYDALVPKGEAIETAKYHTHVVLYRNVASKIGLFLGLDAKSPLSCLIPTLQSLWAYPTILPTLVVGSDVSVSLLNGSQLFPAGVIKQRAPNPPLPNFSTNSYVSIRVFGNSLPFAVARVHVSSDELFGKNSAPIDIVHIFRDSMWSESGGGVPNKGFTVNRIRNTGDPEPLFVNSEAGAMDNEEETFSEEDIENSNVSEERNADTNIQSTPQGDAPDEQQGPNVADNHEEVSAEEVIEEENNGSPSKPLPFWAQLSEDDFFCACFSQAIRTRVKNSSLPLLANVLVGSHMSACRPVDRSFNIRNTVWKKTSDFLKHMEAEAVLTLGNVKNDQGEEVALQIEKIDRSHPFFSKFKPWSKKYEFETSTQEPEEETGQRSTREIKTYKRPTGSLASFVQHCVLGHIALGKIDQLRGTVAMRKKVSKSSAANALMEGIFVDVLSLSEAVKGFLHQIASSSASEGLQQSSDVAETGFDLTSISTAEIQEALETLFQPSVHLLFTNEELKHYLNFYLNVRGLRVPKSSDIKLDVTLAAVIGSTNYSYSKLPKCVSFDRATAKEEYVLDEEEEQNFMVPAPQLNQSFFNRAQEESLIITTTQLLSSKEQLIDITLVSSLPSIIIEEHKVKGKHKFQTVISNLHAYGVDDKEVALKLGKLLASSTSVKIDTNGKDTVIASGKKKEDIRKFLMESEGISSSSIKMC